MVWLLCAKYIHVVSGPPYDVDLRNSFRHAMVLGLVVTFYGVLSCDMVLLEAQLSAHCCGIWIYYFLRLYVDQGKEYQVIPADVNSDGIILSFEP